jgi:hypothetical protein
MPVTGLRLLCNDIRLSGCDGTIHSTEERIAWSLFPASMIECRLCDGAVGARKRFFS